MKKIFKDLSVVVYLTAVGTTFFIPVGEGRYAATATAVVIGYVILCAFVFKKSWLGKLVNDD